MKVKAPFPSAHGFSLIELMIAMTITLIVTGAMYGLLAGGQNAFRREPELSERQQNIRVAMDLIQRDLAHAGVGVGPFFQTFTDNLDGVGPVGPNGDTDFLEIYGNDGSCPEAPVNTTNGANIVTIGRIPSCYSNDTFVLVIYGSGNAKWGLGHNVHAQNFMLNFPPGQQPTGSEINSPNDLKTYGGGDDTVPVQFGLINIFRYEIAPDPTDGVPGLWRSTLGGRSVADGTYANAPDPAGGWQLVARGIEDLQVQYRNATARNGTGWDEIPGPVRCAGTCVNATTAQYQSVIQEVRISLGARVDERNLQGETTAAGVPAAVRGGMDSTSAVKAALYYLSLAPPTANCPNCPIWR